MPQMPKAYGFTPKKTFTITSTSGALFKGVGRRYAGQPEIYAILPDTTDAVDTDYTFHAIPINSSTDSTINGDTYLGVVKHGTVWWMITKE
jgi:hypothetical protein